MSELRLQREDHPGAVLLVPQGWIDLSCVGELQRAIDRALEEEGVRVVAVDLSGAEYIDSATVSVLIRAKGRAEDRTKEFALVSLANQVRRVLEETHLIDVFAVHSSRQMFLDSLSSSPGSPDRQV